MQASLWRRSRRRRIEVESEETELVDWRKRRKRKRGWGEAKEEEKERMWRSGRGREGEDEEEEDRETRKRKRRKWKGKENKESRTMNIGSGGCERGKRWKIYGLQKKPSDRNRPVFFLWETPWLNSILPTDPLRRGKNSRGEMEVKEEEKGNCKEMARTMMVRGWAWGKRNKEVEDEII